MPKVPVYNMSGEVTGEIELNDSIYGVDFNMPAVHQTIKNYLANQRQGTQSTLTRAEVRGGGRKPWRQKGTGRARQGSIRSPQWVGGGVVFAPKPRDYSFGVNKKIKKLALRSILSDKIRNGQFMVMENLDFQEIKTKNALNFLKAMKLAENSEKITKTLMVTNIKNNNLVMSCRNLPKVRTTFVDILNSYEVLNCDKCVITKDAALKLEEVCV